MASTSRWRSCLLHTTTASKSTPDWRIAGELVQLRVFFASMKGQPIKTHKYIMAFYECYEVGFKARFTATLSHKLVCQNVVWNLGRSIHAVKLRPQVDNSYMDQANW